MADLPSTPADGNVKTVWVPAIANPDAPTAAELNDSDNVDMSCYLTADGWAYSSDQATVTDDRMCDTQTFAQPGRKSYSLSLTYIENPTSPTTNKAASTLAEGTVGYFVQRRGIAYDAAFAATQKVWVFPVRMGGQTPVAPSANSVLTMTQGTFITGSVRESVPVAA